MNSPHNNRPDPSKGHHSDRYNETRYDNPRYEDSRAQDTRYSDNYNDDYMSYEDEATQEFPPVQPAAQDPYGQQSQQQYPEDYSSSYNPDYDFAGGGNGNRVMTKYDALLDDYEQLEKTNADLVEDNESLQAQNSRSKWWAIIAGILGVIALLLLIFGSPFRGDGGSGEAEEEVAQLTSENEELQKQLDEANSKAAGSEGANEDLQDQVDSAEKRAEDAERAVSDRDSQIQQKDQQISQLEQQLGEAEGQTTTVTETTTVREAPSNNGGGSSGEPSDLDRLFGRDS